MEIRLKPIKADPWSGLTILPNCNDSLRPYLTRRGSLYTGFGQQYDNLNERKRLEDYLGIDLKPNSKFWKTFSIPVGKVTVVLNSDEPEDQVRLIFLKNHKRVKETLTSKKPNADYYLQNSDIEANVFNELNRNKRKAYKEFDKMKPSDWRKALRLYGDSATSNVSDAVVEDRLCKRIEQNPEYFFKIWVENKSRATEYLLKEAISKNVVRKNKNIYSYGTTTLGNTLEDTIIFIDNSENSDIKAAIINEANINL